MFGSSQHFYPLQRYLTLKWHSGETQSSVLANTNYEANVHISWLLVYNTGKKHYTGLNSQVHWILTSLLPQTHNDFILYSILGTRKDSRLNCTETILTPPTHARTLTVHKSLWYLMSSRTIWDVLVAMPISSRALREGSAMNRLGAITIETFTKSILLVPHFSIMFPRNTRSRCT